MFGFKPASQLAPFTSGMVRGPGTGTSDSVKDAVPPGTFIMPADSTEKIGAERLSGLGFRPGMRQAAQAVPDLPLGFKSRAQRDAEQPPAGTRGPGLGFRPGTVPVSLSNGEFRISPQQVHAIGAQVLDGIKAATHAPADEAGEAMEPGEMEGDGKARPDLFFADGGVVDDPKRDPFAYRPPGSTPPATQPSPIPGAERDDLPVRDTARASYGQIGGPASVKPAAPASPIKGPLDAMGTAYGATAAKMTFGAFDSRADDTQAQNRAGLIAEPATPSTPATPSVTPGQPMTTNPGLSAAPPAPSPTPAAPAATATGVPGIRRIDEPGKSPLFTNVGTDGASGTAPPPSGFGFRPGMGSGSDVLGILQRESQIRAGMGALQDQIGFNGGNGIGFRKVGTDEAIRDMVVNGNSRDRATALGFMGGRQDAADRYDLGQQDVALRQQEAQARQGIAAGEFGLKSEAQGFQSAAARRLATLQDQYLAEQDPTQRGALAQQMRELSGKEPMKPDHGLAVARTNLIGELGKQYAQMQPVGEDRKPVPFETWAAPMLRAAGMATSGPRQQEGAMLRGKDGKMYQVRNGVPVLADALSSGGNPNDRNRAGAV